MADQNRVNEETGQAFPPPKQQITPVVVIGHDEAGELGIVLNGVNAIVALAVIEKAKEIALQQINFKRQEEPKVIPVHGRIPGLNGKGGPH